jgi:nitrate/nitrite transporter NarK
MTFLVGPLQMHFPLKWLLVSAQGLTLIATLLLTFGDSPSHYWPFVFPGFILGTAGIAAAYMWVKYGTHY